MAVVDSPNLSGCKKEKGRLGMSAFARCRSVRSRRPVGKRTCWPVLLLLIGIPSLFAKAQPKLASELPSHAVICVDIPNIAYLASKTADTGFGRILRHSEIAPIARGAMESLESRYLAPYRAVLGIPNWRLLRSYDGGFRYVITFSDDDGFEQFSIFTTRSLEAARSLAARMAADHRDSGGEVSTQAFGDVTTTLLAQTGYHPDRYLVVDGTAVILSTAPDDAIRGFAKSAAEDAGDRASRETTEWKSWLQRTQDKVRGRRAAVTVFADLQRLFRKQPAMKLLASSVLGPDFDGWKFLYGSIEFPAHPYSLVMRVTLHRTFEQRGMLGPIVFGGNAPRLPDWVPASASSTVALRIDPQRTWDRIHERRTGSGREPASGTGSADPLLEWLQSNAIVLGPETMTGRITVARWFDTSVTMNAKSLLLGVELAEPERFRRMLKQVVSRNREHLESKRYRSVNYYVFRQPFQIKLDDYARPTLVKWTTPESPILRRPSNCFAVIGTDLVYSDNANALKHSIDAMHSPTDRLNRLPTFKLVRTLLSRSRTGTVIGKSYWDPSENWRNLYSLLSKDEMVRAIKGYRNPIVQVSKLTSALESRKEIEFHDIAKHIAPCGSVISVSGNDIEWKLIMLARLAKDPAP